MMLRSRLLARVAAMAQARNASAFMLEVSPKAICAVFSFRCDTNAPQSHGDAAGPIDMTYDASGSASGLPGWRRGGAREACSGRSAVIHASDGVAGLIMPTPAEGRQVTFPGLHLGSSQDQDRLSQVSASEIGGTALMSTGAIDMGAQGHAVSGAWGRAMGLAIAMGPDACGAGVDDFAFTAKQIGAGVSEAPLPAAGC